MLILVVSDTKSYRKEQIASLGILNEETVVLDDTMVSLTDLEQYLYPSLFSAATPVVHAQFLLESAHADVPAVFTKKLVASPTVFIFEELTLPTAFLTAIKKHGAIVHTAPVTKSPKKGNDLFALASAIITPNKKDRWMNFQKALEYEPVEALLGIMYWKVRDVMLKNPRTKNEYEALYKNLLTAHARAWQSNTPLELMIEKVLLQ